MCGTCGFLLMVHWGVSALSCCAFIHRVAFKGVSGHRVLIKSGLGNRGLSVCDTTHEGCLEFPREAGLILRCAENVRNTVQTKQGNRPSCCDQEGRRGSDEMVPGTPVFPSSESKVSGNFWGRNKGSKYRFELQERLRDFT